MVVIKPHFVLTRKRQILGIVDAKYKRLWPTASAAQGPQREDLYQLAAYLARYGNSDMAVWGRSCIPRSRVIVAYRAQRFKARGAFMGRDPCSC
jgi:5-methylcytosine-specific restriction endonuclease McrBC regulatory subunit McrC